MVQPEPGLFVTSRFFLGKTPRASRRFGVAQDIPNLIQAPCFFASLTRRTLLTTTTVLLFRLPISADAEYLKSAYNGVPLHLIN